jgi:hypothetical protein
MSRTISSRNQTEIAKSGTVPILLFELGFDLTLRLSTYADLTWNGYTWTRAPIALAALQAAEGGGLAGTLQLIDTDATWAALALNDGVRDRSCRIWQLYGASPYAADDGVPIFEGVMDEILEIGDVLRLSIASTGTLTRRTPDLPLSAWLGADATASGTRLNWNGQTYVLEARDG